MWKSQEPTPPGAAQSPRYGGHGWHGISLKDFKPVKIPLAGDLGAEHLKLEDIKKKGLAEKKAFGGINRGHCHGSTFAGDVWVCPDFQGGLIGFDGATGKRL
ncbi:MAG: hypothetical protein K2V38_27005, partial [Gemmataceae bacterium]|nr:hypothetical protein [Gemmataceae bacterium]